MMLAWDMEVMRNSIYYFQLFISIDPILALSDCAHIATDISGNNIVFTCDHLSSATKEDLFELLGTPISAEMARLDGKPLGEGLPKQLVKTTEWNNWTDEDVEDLRIIDLGESFVQGAEPTKLAQPGPLQAPEIIFTEHFDHRVDLWRAGCVVSCPTRLQNADINTYLYRFIRSYLEKFRSYT